MEIRRQPSEITISHKKKREINLSKSEIWFHTNEFIYFQLDHIWKVEMENENRKSI